MSYQKNLASYTHKSLIMMTSCTDTSMSKYLSHITVEPVLFLYMLSTFSQYALFQDLVYSKVCWTQFTKESDICHNLHNETYKGELEIVQTQSSYWILMSTISLVLPSLLIATYLGSWSDKFGRKWPVVFPPLGGVCACLVYIVISVLEDTSVGWICLASLLSGLTGGFVTCISSCMTYVASVTTEENRTVRISRLEAMTFFGGTVGPFISGSILPITGHAYAFFYMMLCYAFAFLYAILFVKDINKDGFVIENNSRNNLERDIIQTSGEGATDFKCERRRNKSSDTIPSSGMARTLSTSSGGEDYEQKEGLLYACNLHVAIGPDDIISASTEISGLNHDDKQHPVIIQTHENHNHNVNGDVNVGGISSIPHLRNDNEDPVMIAVMTAHKHHYQLPNTDKSNRISMGSSSSTSSGRNSSLRGHDDVSSAASDDDQRNIIRSRHSSTQMDNEARTESCSCARFLATNHVASAIMTVCKKRENGRRPLLILSLISSFIFMVITAGEMDVAYLFARAEPLRWSYQTYSYYFGFKYGLGAFVLLVATPCLQNVGIQDVTLALVGMFSRMAALVVYGLAVNEYMVFSVPVFSIVSVFTIPATRSLLSKLVGPGEQGKMFAFVAMMEDICTLSASLIFNSIYPITRSILQGLIFLLAATALLLPMAIMFYVRCKLIQIRKLEDAARESKANVYAVDRTDPSSRLCLPCADYELGK